MDRKSHWEAVYRTKAPSEVSWYQAQPSLSLELIHRCVSSPDAAIIDVGGGASLLVDRLLEAGYRRPAVLDISSAALAASKQRLGERAAAVDWLEADITKFHPARPFDVWHDRAVFHFLTEAVDRKAYVTVLNESLKPGGNALIAAFTIGGPVKCSGLDIIQYDRAKLVGELGSDFEFIEQRDELHITPAGKEQKFIYLRFRKKTR